MFKNAYIELLTIGEEHFLYDVNTNTISQISADLYNALNSSNKEYSLEVSDEIRELKAHGMLQKNPLKTIIHPATKFLASYFDHCSTITLQMTQLCNFKCRYCGFASEYAMERFIKMNLWTGIQQRPVWIF